MSLNKTQEGWLAIHIGEENSKLKHVHLDLLSHDMQRLLWQIGRNYLIQRFKHRYSDILLDMQNVTRNRTYCHPLHTDITPDILTGVLPLDTVRLKTQILQ